MLDISLLGDEVLREPTERVTVFDSALSLLVDAMFDTMDEADGVGLAAPQVGVSKRIFVVDTRQEGGRIAFINPEIVETSEERSHYEEGCLSVPGIYKDVIRPAAVTVQAQDVTGHAFTIKATGLLARVVQHENDHLYGKLFIDRLPDEEREKVLRQWERRSKGRGKRKK